MANDYIPTTEEIRAAALTDYREEEITPQQFDRWLAEVKAQAIGDAIAYLKTTPAVTLVGKGGAYELLEAYAQKLEDNG